MISLGSDNHSGVHPAILQAITRANLGHSPSYGTDELSMRAIAVLREHFGASADPYFVFNGTAANVLGLYSLLRSHEAIITTDSAHLQLDECGAPEKHIGCKILTVAAPDGKLTPEGAARWLVRRGDQHAAQPRAVSITQPTELGTLYSLAELRALRDFTRKNNLFLHIDGSRLIYAAEALNCSLKALTEDIGADAVSFGGTKNGLLFGEVVLLYHPSAKENFRFARKQLLQLPSKMRFLAAQFLAFFENNLWREIAGNGLATAQYLSQRLSEVRDVEIVQRVEANSVFARIPKRWTKDLRDRFFFYVWDEEEWVVRWMISFDVAQSDIDDFIEHLKSVARKHADKESEGGTR